MTKIRSAVACNLDTHILSACLPLFESEKVEAMEWSFDALFQVQKIPFWFEELLQTFSREGRLIGHGVFFSLFSGTWSSEQQEWLVHLEKLSSSYNFDHITEHFGFMTGADFHKGAPIGIPFTQTILAIGQDRLKRIYEACKCPVGLENLAFSYSMEEVRRHGEFLDLLVEPVNGFLILDLHNLYCQIHNFDMDFEDIIRLYPLERVREIHISGGSWEHSVIHHGKKIRRDTHDDAVPSEVFQLLEKSIKLCPNLKYVVLEQIGAGLQSEESRSAFQQDFIQMEKIVEEKNNNIPERSINSFLPESAFQLSSPLEDQVLYHQQQQLSEILETAADYREAQQRLQTSALANTAWKTEQWAPEMLETALRIARKWK